MRPQGDLCIDLCFIFRASNYEAQAMVDSNVNLVRRSSGGGAVYQDLGNTNFTFVAKEKDLELSVNFRTVLQALQTLGINAVFFLLIFIPTLLCSHRLMQSFSGRNDIVVDGRKISGSAFKHASGHSMHHGTLLANVNMGVMSRVLTPSSLKLQSKGVASVAARVINLSELNPLIDHQALTSALIHSFQQNFFCSSSAVTCLDQSAIMSLSEVAVEAQKLQVEVLSGTCCFQLLKAVLLSLFLTLR
jgi:lipoate-protein ligase A